MTTSRRVRGRASRPPHTSTPTHPSPHHHASESTPSPAPPRSPSPPLLAPLTARPPDCSSDSLPHAPHAPARPPRLPPPRLRPSLFTPGLPCPGLFGRSRKGGPARSGGPPFLESPGAQAKPGPEAGRRPVDLLRPTTRDQHPKPPLITGLLERRAIGWERSPLPVAQSANLAGVGLPRRGGRNARPGYYLFVHPEGGCP